MIRTLEDLQQIKQDYDNKLGKYKYLGVCMRRHRMCFRKLRGC